MVATKLLSQTINTERLYLRRFQKEDWWDLYECLSDPEVMKYEPPLTDQQRHEWADARIASNDFWAICLADTGKMIGNIYLGESGQGSWEVGYMVNSQYQKRGYATEAIWPLICRAFQIEGAHRVCAFCNPENVASWRLLDKLGFRREGLIKQNVYFHQDADGNPVWQDTLLYGILKDEWRAIHIPE